MTTWTIEDWCHAAGIVAAIALLSVAALVGYGFYMTHAVSKRGRVLVHVPHVWTLNSLWTSVHTTQRASTRDHGRYVPARPWANIGGLRHRCRCAWLAFTGRCDLVRWPEGQ